MSSDTNSRKAAPKQKKTYGKGVKSHLSGWFGRDLWSAVEPTVVSKKKGGDKKVTVEDDELAEKQLVNEQKQRLSSDTDKSVDGGVKLKTPIAVVREVPCAKAVTLDGVEVREVKVLEKEGDFTDLEAEIDGILESMGKLDVQTSHDQTAATTARIDLTGNTAELDPETRSTHSLSSVQFKETSDKENEEPQSTPPSSPIYNSLRNSRRKPPTSSEGTPREALRERSISPDGSTVLDSPARKNGVRKRGARRSVISMQSPIPSPLKREEEKVPQGGENEGDMENPITVWEDESMGVIQVGPLVNLLGRKASKVELPEIPGSGDAGEEKENAAAIMAEPVHSGSSEEGSSKVSDKEDKGLPVIDLEEVCLARVLEKPHEEEPALSAGSPSAEQLLHLCTKPSVLDFEEYIDSLAETSSIRKLGEASYSEVFLQLTPGSLSTTVLKVIPFGGPDQCELKSIIQEVRITKAMGDIEGFIGFRGAFVVRGYFPQLLMDEWDIYDEERGSENERPDFYAEDQHFAIICLENGGTDLEHFYLEGWEEAWEVFWQVTLALARGEKERDFEHRDLHYGNIVIRRVSDDDSGEELLGKLSLRDSDAERPEEEPTEVKQCDTKLDVALIDYTLSRAVCGSGEGGGVDVEFAPLDDNALFTGKGDYQFDIYRFMRNHLSTGLVEPSEEWIDWNVYTPKTNTYWLHYLTNILLNKKQIPRPAARGRNAATEEQKRCYKHLETAAKILDPRKRKFGKDQAVCGSVMEFVEWAVKEGISEKGI